MERTESVEFGWDAAREYLATVRWQFAATMPQWPHDYTVKAWQPAAQADFEAMCRFIQEHGTAEHWPAPPPHAVYHHSYLVLDGFKYWAMGPQGDTDPIEDKSVINRITAT